MKLEPKDSSAYTPNVSVGLFRLPFNVYKEDDGLNNSSAKIILRSVAHWRASLEVEKEISDDMVFGSLVHCATLEPDAFGREKSHFLIPANYETTENKCPSCGSVTDAKKCKKCGVDRVETPVVKEWNGRSTHCQEWLAAHSDLPIIDLETEHRVYGCQKALWANPLLAAALESGWTEVSAFAVDPVTGIRLKGRFDLICLGSDGFVWNVDLKKVQDAESPGKAFADRKYQMQDRWYCHLLNLLGFSKVRMLFACHEDEAPFPVVVHELDGPAQTLGDSQRMTAISRFKAWKETGVVESYPKASNVINSLSLPRWALNQE